jgi:hypothetical protein
MCSYSAFQNKQIVLCECEGPRIDTLGKALKGGWNSTFKDKRLGDLPTVLPGVNPTYSFTVASYSKSKGSFS